MAGFSHPMPNSIPSLGITILALSNALAGSDSAYVQAIHDYCALGRYEEAARLIREKPYLASAVNNEQELKTPLHTAAEYGRAPLVRLLLRNGAKPLAKERLRGFNALHYAAEKGHREAVCVLLEHKTDVTVRTDLGFSPLDLAAANGHDSIIHLLLEAGASLDPEPRTGRVPLHDAAGRGHVRTVRLLLDRGSNVNATTASGETPLAVAVHNGHLSVADLLIRRGASMDFWSAVGLGDKSYVAKKLQLKPDLVNLRLEHSPYTPLHLAAKHGKSEIVSLLIRYKADVNISHFGLTALHVAAENQQSKVMKLLLANGAVIDAPDDGGVTPLHVAIRTRSLLAIHLLIDRKANVNSRDKNAATPLHYAITYDNPPEVVDRLLANGANPNSRDRTGTTPILAASRSANSRAYLALLVKYGGKE